MKLKFRADKKDFMVFLYASLLLLVGVAIVVVNAYGILNEPDPKFTFNFIPALFPPRLWYTLLGWIVLLAVLVFAVENPFFTREKGFVFKEGNEEKGFGRFAKEKEYQKFEKVEPVELLAKEATAAGFPLCYDKKKNLAYVDNGEAHSLVIGATGSGKTTMVINPLVNFLAKKGESMVITDPKGEIYEKNGEMLKDKGYDVIVVNFRDPKNGSCWNPYSLPYKYYKEGNTDKANELLNDMAINIATDEKADDPFWTNSAADYLTGLSLGMFEDAKEEEVSISTVNLMMTVGDEKIGNSTYLKEYFRGKDPASPAAINALGTINAPQDTKNSIDSVLKQKIKVFAVTKNLSEMLSRSDFDMETIGERKTAVFMIIQDEKTTYHALATIFVKQCYESLIAVAQRHGGKLPYRTNFLLDEFANMPKFKDITTMITAARSRQIRMTMIIQNFAQLKQVYGQEDAETIRGNCGNILYLLTGELSALEEISKLCGDKIVKVGKDKKEETRPLITVTELQRFKQDEVLVLKHRLPPLRTKFLPFWCTDFGYGKNAENVPAAKLPEHEQMEIKMFDIREYVKKKKEEERAKNMANPSNPFGPAGGANPFANPSGGMFGANPFGPMPSSPSSPSANPFGGGGNPFGANPFGPQPSPETAKPSPFGDILKDTKPSEPSKDEFDIDDLVKKLDAKIAELEKEEAEQEKAKGNIPKASEVKSEPGKIDFDAFDEDIMDDFIEDLTSEIDEAKDEKMEEIIGEMNDVSEKTTKVVADKAELDKIMNKKEPSDDFEEFFE